MRSSGEKAMPIPSGNQVYLLPVKLWQCYYYYRHRYFVVTFHLIATVGHLLPWNSYASAE